MRILSVDEFPEIRNSVRYGGGRYGGACASVDRRGGRTAALALRIPVIAMEPNAVPGITNLRLGRFVRKTLLAFPETARYFPARKTEVTGLPVREEFFAIPPRPRGPALRLLITGGSGGSRTLNNAARQSWPLFRAAGFPVYILHQTGRDAFEDTHTAFAKSGLAGEVVPFIENMPRT